ncbi:MAG TPA: ArsC/Spx/MgsR family protein [Candidatus Saccharimonadales bacterium]|nr:ArsC/Spx/MgsR family protein [Candidatus Saccharimonadales bacterium]
MLERRVEFEARDLFKQPLDERELAQVLAGLEPEEFLSRRSGAFTALGYGRRIPPRAQVVRDVARDPGLLRRPLMVGPRGERVVGFDRRRYEELFPLR